MYSNFVFVDRFLFELSCKNTHTHRDSDEYPIVAFSKNATIMTMIMTSNVFLCKQIPIMIKPKLDLMFTGHGVMMQLRH